MTLIFATGGLFEPAAAPATIFQLAAGFTLRAFVVGVWTDNDVWIWVLDQWSQKGFWNWTYTCLNSVVVTFSLLDVADGTMWAAVFAVLAAGGLGVRTAPEVTPMGKTARLVTGALAVTVGTHVPADLGGRFELRRDSQFLHSTA